MRNCLRRKDRWSGNAQTRSDISIDRHSIAASAGGRMRSHERSCRVEHGRDHRQRRKSHHRHHHHQPAKRQTALRRPRQRQLEHRRGAKRGLLRSGHHQRKWPLYAASPCFPGTRCKSRSWRPPKPIQGQRQAICSPLPLDSSRCLRLKPPAWRPEAPFRSQDRSLRSTPAPSSGRLGTTPGGEIDPGDSYGSIGETRCTHSSRTYTSCTATYTAPRVLPSGTPSVFVVGLGRRKCPLRRSAARSPQWGRVLQLGPAKPIRADRLRRDGLFRRQCQRLRLQEGRWRQRIRE